jgi:hypothetical protein
MCKGSVARSATGAVFHLVPEALLKKRLFLVPPLTSTDSPVRQPPMRLRIPHDPAQAAEPLVYAVPRAAQGAQARVLCAQEAAPAEDALAGPLSLHGVRIGKRAAPLTGADSRRVTARPGYDRPW